MAIFWTLVALIVLIAVIAALNRRPGRSGLPGPYSNPGTDSGSDFNDVSGPASINFVELLSRTPAGHDTSGSGGHHGGFTGHDRGGHSSFGDGGGHGGVSDGGFGGDSGGSGGGDGGGGGGD